MRRAAGFALVAAFLFGAVAPSPSFAQPSQRDGSGAVGAVQAEKVRNTVRRLKTSLNIPGLAVAIFDSDEVLFRQTLGDVDPSSQFFLGSLTKALTATLVLRVVDQTELELETPARRYLPWELPRQTRIVDLLHHRTGIPRGMGFVSWRGGPDDLGRHLESLEFGPGPHTFEYSNLNYAILGRIVEEVTERPYRRALRQHVLEPLGMNRTLATPNPTDIPDLAGGHQYVYGFPVDSPEHEYYGWEVPSRFVVSTVSDMVHFGQLHLADADAGSRLLEAAHLRRIHSGSKGRTTGHVMGWFAERHAGLRMLRHEGLTTSYHSAMALIPGENVGVVVLANVNSYGAKAAGKMSRNLALMAAGRSTEPLTNLEFVLRLALGGFVLIALLFLGYRIVRWGRTGFRVGLLPGALWRIGPALLAAVGIIGGVAWYYRTPLAAIFTLQPDLWFALVAIPISAFLSILVGEWLRFARVDADPETPTD